MAPTVSRVIDSYQSDDPFGPDSPFDFDGGGGPWRCTAGGGRPDVGAALHVAGDGGPLAHVAGVPAPRRFARSTSPSRAKSKTKSDRSGRLDQPGTLNDSARFFGYLESGGGRESDREDWTAVSPDLTFSGLHTYAGSAGFRPPGCMFRAA